MVAVLRGSTLIGYVRRTVCSSALRCSGKRVGNGPEFELLSAAIGRVRRGQVNPDRITGTTCQQQGKKHPVYEVFKNGVFHRSCLWRAAPSSRQGIVGAAFQPRFSRRSQGCFGEVGSSRQDAAPTKKQNCKANQLPRKPHRSFMAVRGFSGRLAPTSRKAPGPTRKETLFQKPRLPACAARKNAEIHSPSATCRRYRSGRR